jgi:hypothetical protein
MELEIDRHASDEALEEYSIGCLATGELQEFEEHLLICARCQDSVALTDAYGKAWRVVLELAPETTAPVPSCSRLKVAMSAQV